MEPVMEAVAPFPTASMAITAATPITMPSTVRPERILLEFRLSSDLDDVSEKGSCLPCLALDHAITDADNALGLLTDRRIVRDDDESGAAVPCSDSTASVMISLPTLESRLPVGSSAMMMAGLLTMARGDRDALLLPAGELHGAVTSCGRPAQQLPGRRAPVRGARHSPDPHSAVAIRHWRERVCRESRLNDWKTKPTLWLRILAS